MHLLLCSSNLSMNAAIQSRQQHVAAGRHSHRAAALLCRASRKCGRDGSSKPRADSTMERTTVERYTTEASTTLSSAFDDILAPTPGSSGVSYKLERDPLQSAHPDAIKRRLRAEKRKKKRRMVCDAVSKGRAWWRIECTPNVVVVTSSDAFYHELRVARKQERDFVVQYFSPNCSACKEEALRCAQIAAKNPDHLFLRVHYDKCKGVSEFQHIQKLPWVQYWKHSDREGPSHEDVHLGTFNHLLEVPPGLETTGGPGGPSYCSISPSVKEIANFDTLLQAIYM